MLVGPAILTLAQAAPGIAAVESGPSWQWVATVAVNALVVVVGLVIRQHLAAAARERKETNKQTQDALTGVKESITALSTRMGAIEQRLHDGDARFERLDKRDREIETRMVEGLTKIDTRLNHVEQFVKEIASSKR